MTLEEATQPDLFVACEERAREIAARCRTVERACRAIGFPESCGYERIAALVARVTSSDCPQYVGTVRRIADDSSVNLSERHVRRAIDELQAEGVILVARETSSDIRTRGRGRVPSVWSLCINWDRVHEVVAAHEKWLEERRRAASADLRTRRGHDADKTPAQHGQNPGIKPASADSGALYTLTQNPVPREPDSDPPEAMPEESRKATADPSDPWAAAAASLDGFVDGVVRLKSRTVEAAQRAGMTPADLVALGVQTRRAKLPGGAVLAAIRSGDWRDLVASVAERPAARGSPPRADGHLEAERTRHRACKDYRQATGRRGTMLDDPAVVALSAQRILAAGLSDYMTDAERSTMQCAGGTSSKP